MTLEFWNTVAAWGTFTVIAATAIAAVVQLNHMRHSNQLGGLLTTFGILQDPALRDLINYVRHDLQANMKDDVYRRSLLDTPVDRAKHPEFYIIDVYNHIGAFLRGGLIDEEIYMRTEWYNVRLYWNLLVEPIAIRRTLNPYVFENFEYLAARAEAWVAKHPKGDYPPTERRLELPAVPDVLNVTAM
ncbi:MAG: hypothetical protein JO165_06250 [Candidatus Eremiobacteraeota bacterium]|nr:hypothetical protein [Candidatus Eremiobacteraeota bacterium]